MRDSEDKPQQLPPGRISTVLPAMGEVDGSSVIVPRAQARYERVDSLGEGAMGLVELSRDHDIGRLVAIKSLKESGDPEQVLRFTREVQALGQLEHPGIVPVYDVGRAEDGSYFLVMKHLDGESLASLIRKLRAGDARAHASAPLHERVRICEAVLHIVEYAHAQGVVHRDLKPANVMLGPHGEVTVVDWGLAKRLDAACQSEVEARADQAAARPSDDDSAAATRAGARMGTPIYMSPEQASGDASNVGVASDIYSMGVAFYEFLCLEHYLEGREEIHDVLKGVLHDKARFAYWIERKDQERLPIELAYWLEKAMKKSIGDRFPSAALMREELQSLASGKFSVVCPTTMTRRMFRAGMDAANRRPIGTLLGLVALLTLAVAGLLSIASALL